jgi:vWA-MoxR associated protein C-terminal domain
MGEFMELKENQINSFCEEIYKIFPSSEKLNEVLNQNEDLKGKLVLEIKHNNLNDINCLNKLNKYNKNNSTSEKINLLILEAHNTEGIDRKREYEVITSSIFGNDNQNIVKHKKQVIVHDYLKLREATDNSDYKICHFFGHGRKAIKLGTEEVKPETLKVLFESRTHFQCVVFNACSSAEAAKQVSEHIDYVIGMNTEISDKAAIQFSEGFYGGLKSSINNNEYIFLRGFREGIIAIQGDNNSQYNIPVLYVNYKRAVLNLIKQLEAENKIEEFLRIFSEHSPTNKLINELYHNYSYPIKQPDLDNLVQIVRKIEDSNLVKSAYRETLPENATVDNSQINNPQTIDNIIDILREQYPLVPNNVPSILEFAKNLAGKFVENSEEYQGIKTWIEQVSSKLSISIDVKPKTEFRSQEIYTYLLIIVNDEGNDKFNLRAEYLLEDENCTIIEQKSLNLQDHNQQTGIICDSFKEIPNQIQKYLDELYNKLSGNDLKRITIELFLPIKYLKNNLDKEWRCADGLGGTTLIVREYNIVVRPSERMNNNRFHITLKNNFQRFIKNLNKYSDADLLDQEIEIINQNIIDSNYQQISDNFKDKKIGIKLNHNGTPEIAFFKAIIRGAIVIAFWRGCSIPEGSNLDDINNQLKVEFFKNNCRNLIKEMHELRKKASYNDDENFYPLGFLCDNPYRIPNIKPLKSF